MRAVIISFIGLVCMLVAGGVFYLRGQHDLSRSDTSSKTSSFQQILTEAAPTSTPTPRPTLPPIPAFKTIPGGVHVFQTFNNCGPASLSMALSLYGISVSQQDLGRSLRPYQNPQGDNDDKSVTLNELAKKATEYDLVPYHRPNGSIEKVKQFIAHDIPVITRTWLEPHEDIGHYRVLKGYDENDQTIIQDDSLQGANLRYSYTDLLDLWEAFGYEYLILVPKSKEAVVEAILAEDLDEQAAWKRNLERIEIELEADPENVYARFNQSVAFYELGRFYEAIEAYEQIEESLPERMLWYQIEPILAYYHSGNDAKVLAMTDEILHNHNRAFSELYQIRSEVYKRQGNHDRAEQELQRVTQYNSNYFTYVDIL